VNRVYEPCLKQFIDLSFDSCCFPRIKWTKFLSNKLSVRIRGDLMFNYFQIDAWHFLVRPSKNIAELFKKIRVNLNLFGGEIRSDEDIIHDVGVSRDIDRYRGSDSRHISLSINILCSQEVNGTRLISHHGDGEFSCLDSV
jgi:hypothetical protein